MGYSKHRADVVSGPDSEQGANLVEFAVLAPLLILLVLGIVELGWLFGQFNDIRHGAREGARFAAVDGGNAAAIQQRVCTSMDGLSAGITALRVELTDGTGSGTPPPTPGTTGTVGTIRVEADIDSLSGLPLITSFLPPDLNSEVQFALEQDSTQWSTTGLVNVTC